MEIKPSMKNKKERKYMGKSRTPFAAQELIKEKHMVHVPKLLVVKQKYMAHIPILLVIK